jgi:hypothetical protein
MQKESDIHEVRVVILPSAFVTLQIAPSNGSARNLLHREIGRAAVEARAHLLAG